MAIPIISPHTDRAAWLAERRNGLGASDIAAILGLNKYKTPRKLWQEKKGLVAEPEPTDAMIAGIDLEPYIGARFARESGVELVPCDMVIGDEPWMRATPDFMAADGSFLVEIKNVSYWSGKDFGEKGTTELPDMYLVQVMWQLIVTGNKLGYLAVLIGGQDFRVYPVDYSETLAMQLLQQASKFWHEYVLADVMPPISAGDDASDLYNQDNGTSFSADAAANALAEEYKEACKEFDKAEAKKLRIQNELKEIIGDAAAMHTKIGEFTWRKNRDSETYDWKLMVKLVPDEIREQCKKTKTGARVFMTPWSKGGNE